MTENRYPAWMRRLHWLIFALVAFAFVLIFAHGAAERGTELRANLKWGHVQFGVAVLLAMIARLIVRARHRAEIPPITPPLAAWQAWTAKLVHGALYVLLVAVPVLGGSMMVLKGRPWSVLGIPMPTLAEPSEALAERVETMHENLGVVILALSILHVAVSLYHHLVRKDDALRRMLPG